MDWNAIVGIAEVVGTGAVVVSLFYVAVQIKQNTGAMRTASAQNLITVSTNAHLLIASDNGLAQIIQIGINNPESLKDYEQLKFNSSFLALYVQYDFAYRQFLRGELEPATWTRMEFEILVFLRMPGGAAWWKQDKARMSPEFVKFIDDHLDKFELPDTLPTIGRNDARPAA
jgi:hypothetical protein